MSTRARLTGAVTQLFACQRGAGPLVVSSREPTSPVGSGSQRVASRPAALASPVSLSEKSGASSPTLTYWTESLGWAEETGQALQVIFKHNKVCELLL